MTPYYEDDNVTLYHGRALDVMREIPDGSVDCIVTSPPYFGLRDYGVDGQYGAEETPQEFVDNLVALYREARRVLANDGTFWLNLGDSYQSTGGMEGVGPNAKVGSTKRQALGRTRPRSGLPTKNLIGIPWRVALALQDDGWILRNDIIWAKPNAMPESVTDRLSTRHEHLFLFTKSQRYWFDLDPIREPHKSEPGREGQNYMRGQKAMRPVGPNSGNYSKGGRNPGDVWEIATQPFSGAHFAVFPQELPRRCIAAGCKPDGTVLDPCSGSGTTGAAAVANGRKYVGIDINADYLDLSLSTRLQQPAFNFGEAS